MTHAPHCSIAVPLSGVGTRWYYRRQGYELDGGEGKYMLKQLSGRNLAAREGVLGRRSLLGLMAGLVAVVAMLACGWGSSGWLRLAG